MNLQASELVSLCSISQPTEMEDEKRPGLRAPGEAMVVFNQVLRSSPPAALSAGL